MVTGSTRGAPVHGMAKFSIVTAVIACTLAFYGSMHAEKHIAGAPLREARGAAGLPAQPGSWVERQWVSGETSVFGERIDRKVLAATERSKIVNYTVQILAYVLPFVLGIGAAVAGGAAMRAIERTGGKFGGNTLAVFSMLIGGLASVVAGCMMVSLYLWPRLPSFYTT
ncbi:hypothetical protein VT84_14950 [Gemmata sp. SH-PL17]|uniref:hypothetical protein n=1 Tax=Gemmata sp. SH-PL17 TaxID=1630693 RepID=UPI0004AEB596|nr:hypothetical protein [Gemmata sp. SH-PL17]AMV25693.1 hypothetical protein VT84_14950 [Gemmata sp. SH-PL17]